MLHPYTHGCPHYSPWLMNGPLKSIINHLPSLLCNNDFVKQVLQNTYSVIWLTLFFKYQHSSNGWCFASEKDYVLNWSNVNHIKLSLSRTRCSLSFHCNIKLPIPARRWHQKALTEINVIWSLALVTGKYTLWILFNSESIYGQSHTKWKFSSSP